MASLPVRICAAFDDLYLAAESSFSTVASAHSETLAVERCGTDNNRCAVPASQVPLPISGCGDSIIVPPDGAVAKVTVVRSRPPEDIWR